MTIESQPPVTCGQPWVAEIQSCPRCQRPAVEHPERTAAMDDAAVSQPEKPSTGGLRADHMALLDLMGRTTAARDADAVPAIPPVIPMGRTSVGGNLALSQKMHAVADALAAYDPLPALSHASVWSKHHDIESETSLRFMYSRNELRNLCVWASALDVEVTISLSYGGSGEAFIMFDLGGCPAKLRVSLHSGQAYELGAALKHPISPDEPSFQVTAAVLRDALGVA